MQEQFGRYVLLERIAVGGMAEIFRAKAPGLGGFEKVLAIKRLHPRYSQDEDFIEMLIDEARITVELSHSNIGQIFDLGKVDDHYFIAMEFIDGRDAYRVLRRLREVRQRMPLEAAAYIAAEACAGLDFAHRKKDSRGRPLHVVHRDVSPQNILVSYDGEVKIVDFGIAKATHRAYETEAGVIKGKVYCMSPEQARGEVLDHRTDIFSLGICLYEMVTGELVYKDDDDATLLSQVRKADIQPPSTIRPEIPSRFEQIIMRSLARERSDRYPSAQHMQRDLQRFLSSYDASFGQNKLGAYMKTLFEIGANSNDVSGVENVLEREEFIHDKQSVMPVASFEDGDDRTMNEDEALNESESVMELNSDLFEIVENSELVTGMVQPSNAMATADESPSNDEFFDEGPTRTFDRDGQSEQQEPIRSEVRRAIPVVGASQDAVRHRPEPVVPVLEPKPATRPRPKPQRSAGGDIASFQEQPTAVFADDIQQDAPIQRGPRLAARPSAFGGDAAPSEASQGSDSISGALKGVLSRINREWLYVSLSLIVVVAVTGGVTSWMMGDKNSKTPNAAPLVRVNQSNVGSATPPTSPQVNQLSSVGATGTPQAAKQPPIPPKQSSSAVSGGRGTLRIVSQPNGARIRVDGAWLPEMTPTRVVVPSGRRIEVRIKHRKYQAYDIQQVVQSGEERQVNAVLVPLYGTIQVESLPSQALIFVNGEERGRTPSTLARLALDTPVRIRLVKDGWKAYETTINWDDGTERRHRDVNATLKSVERDPPAVVPAAKPAPARARKRRRARRRPARRTRRAVRRTRPRPPPRPRGFGKLNVMTSPWAAIYVDGRKVSPESPLLGHRLSEGSHRVYVCFRNDPQNCASPRTVNIRANESSKVIFKQ